jgi:heat shock protein HslJ
VRAPAGANSADYVKDCQIRATLAREQELADFVADDSVAAATANEPLPAAPAVAAERPAQREAPLESVAQPTAPAYGTAPVARPDEPVASESAPRANEWRLVKWVANGAKKSVVPDSVVTIAFDPSGKISGNASVNRFNGTYRFDVDGHLQWPRAGFALSRQAGLRALMAQERAFLESLRRTTQYRVDGQQLVLESQGGATVLVFTR